MGIRRKPSQTNTMRVFALLATAALASAALELSPDTFNSQVIDSGKNAFVKFLAPW